MEKKRLRKHFPFLSFKWHFSVSLFWFSLHTGDNSQPLPAFSAYFLQEIGWSPTILTHILHTQGKNSEEFNEDFVTDF